MSKSDDKAAENTAGDTTPVSSDPDSGAAESSAPETNVRAARRAQREAERAARAQRKADAARQRALEAARAGGLFEGMEASASPEKTPAPGPTAPLVGPGHNPGPTPASGPQETSLYAAPLYAPPAREPMDPARQQTLTLILAAVSVVLVVVAGLATWQYLEAREATAAEEQMANAPTAATDAAREVATQMFTYDHRTVDEDLAAVRERLTDPALNEFVEQSMPTVASAAKQQEATVYATVAAAAPQEVVDENNVTVLVMLNRMVSTKDNPEAASSASRLSLRMERDGDTWKLAELNAL